MQAKHTCFNATKEVANHGTPKGRVRGSGAGSDSLAGVLSHFSMGGHETSMFFSNEMSNHILTILDVVCQGQ